MGLGAGVGCGGGDGRFSSSYLARHFLVCPRMPENHRISSFGFSRRGFRTLIG